MMRAIRLPRNELSCRRLAARADEGFTLLEVLVALTILSISLGVLFAIFSRSLDRARTNRGEMQARVLAQSLLEQTAVADLVHVGVTQGHDSNGLSWTLRVEPFGSAEDRATWHLKPVAVAATVTWSDAQEHSLTLKTLRLAAGEPPP